MSQPLVFISYSHRDEAEKDSLLSHLSVLEPSLIRVWSDDRIDAGVKWESEIDNALSEAKVALLFITANFLTSEFILHKEVPKLLERHRSAGLVVIPVIAKACAWKKVGWLTSMNVRPKDGRPVWGDAGAHVDEDLANIAEEVADIVERATPLITKPLEDLRSKTLVNEPRKSPHLQKTRSPRILIVDDDPKFRKSLISVFKKSGFVFIEAGSVEEALRQLENAPATHLILLDLELGNQKGTELLDILKQRDLKYRVIILTGHEELLEAEKAKSYDVFLYLMKGTRMASESLTFAVEQAISDVERERLEQVHNIEGFEDVILNRYPTPFSYIYQELVSDLPPLDKLVRQKDLTELLLVFTAQTLICQYLNQAARDNELSALIKSKADKPSSGDWFNILNEVLRKKDSLSASVFLSPFSTFFNSKNRTAMGELIQIRNKYVGHGAKHTDYEYEALVNRCDKFLIPLLQQYKFITEFLMCQISTVKKTKAGYFYRLTECIGANPQLLYARRTFSSLLDADEMLLIHLKTEESISLHPFVLLKDCPECKLREIFFFTKFAKDKMHYLSYRTGHLFATTDYVNDFLDLVGPSLA